MVFFLFVDPLALDSQAKHSTTWTPAIYRGIIVGQSTRGDVVKILGKPKWIGKEQDTGLPMVNYSVSRPIVGTLVIYLHQDKVDGMVLTPDRPYTKREITHVLGANYTLVRYETDDCLGEGGASPIYESRDGPIVHLEYRDRGLAVVLKDDQVEAIAFVNKRFGPTHSRCGSLLGKPRGHP